MNLSITRKLKKWFIRKKKLIKYLKKNGQDFITEAQMLFAIVLFCVNINCRGILTANFNYSLYKMNNKL